MKNKYSMYKVQDYNNSVHPVTCKGQHLTRMIKTHDLTFYLSASPKPTGE